MQAMSDEVSSSAWEKRNTETCQSFCYNKGCNGKLTSSSWITLLESNCLEKQNKLKKNPLTCPLCFVKSNCDLWFLFYVSDPWLMCHASVSQYPTICWAMLEP